LVSGTKPSYISLQEWAKEQFRLKSAPSRSLVAKLLKNKAEIFAKNLGDSATRPQKKANVIINRSCNIGEVTFGMGSTP